MPREERLQVVIAHPVADTRDEQVVPGVCTAAAASATTASSVAFFRCTLKKGERVSLEVFRSSPAYHIRGSTFRRPRAPSVVPVAVTSTG
jgi:arginase family enzyme